MEHFTINKKASNQISQHMNHDHLESLKYYAKKYLNINSPQEISMLSINSKSLILLIEGKEYQIMFDHELTSRKDAHETLVQMSK